MRLGEFLRNIRGIYQGDKIYVLDINGYMLGIVEYEKGKPVDTDLFGIDVSNAKITSIENGDPKSWIIRVNIDRSLESLDAEELKAYIKERSGYMLRQLDSIERYKAELDRR